jgi:hypothetical protein
MGRWDEVRVTVGGIQHLRQPDEHGVVRWDEMRIEWGGGTRYESRWEVFNTCGSPTNME